MNSSFWGKIRIPFFIGLLILVLAAGFFLYERLRGGVDLGIKLPEEAIELGVPFELELTLANNSANTLKDVSLKLELPQNILLVDNPDEKIISRGIGDVVNGRMHRETFRVVAVPAGESNYKIKSAVYYVPASISASLQKREEVDLKVRTPDISLALTAPERVFAGEDLEAMISYKNNLEPKENNYSLELKVNYPPDLSVTERNPAPKGEDMRWPLEGAGIHEGNVSLKGNIELPDDATFSLTAELIMKILGKEYPVISNTKIISINPSPLSFKVTLANSKEAVEPGEELTYLLQYRNNADVPLEDVVVTAVLKGEMLDISTLETNGAADLLSQTLIWSPLQIKELEILDPGEGGQVSFTIKVKSDPNAIQSRKNPVLEIHGRIESPTVPPPLTFKKTVNLSSLETKVTASSSQQ